jgi:hypothetical protein
MYQVTINIGKASKYNGTFDCETLAAAVHKVNANIETDITRIGAAQAIKENGVAFFWSQQDGSAKIKKA